MNVLPLWNLVQNTFPILALGTYFLNASIYGAFGKPKARNPDP